MPHVTVRLRALEGRPLDDPVVRDTVIATAHGIGERTGITVINAESEGDAVVVTLDVDQLAALGFLAELRRVTETWYSRKFGGEPLWGRVPGDGPAGDGGPS
jgi:hypothetical protein